MGRKKKTPKVEELKDALYHAAPAPSKDTPGLIPARPNYDPGPGRSKKVRAKARKRARLQGIPPPAHSLRRDDPHQVARIESILWPTLAYARHRTGSGLKLQARTDSRTRLTEYIYPLEKNHKGRHNVLWHGTSAEGLSGILEGGFKRSVHGLLGPGVYVGNRDKAVNYAKQFVGRFTVLLKVAVTVGDVIDIGAWKDDPKTPHDTVYCPSGENPYAWGGAMMFEEGCVRDPKRVKVLAVHFVPR